MSTGSPTSPPGSRGALPPGIVREPLLSPEPPTGAVELPEWECNRVLEGDCLELLSEVPDRSVHLVLCDLPYGTTRNRWDSVIPLEPLWREYRRILAHRGVIVLTAQGSFTARVIGSNEKWFRYKLIWVKSKSTNFLNAKRQPLRRHEDVCVFYPRQPEYRPQMQPGAAYDKGTRKDQLTGSYGEFRPVQVASEGMRYPTDVVYFKTAESEGPVWHATQKPVALGRYLVRTYTRPGQVVLDNACGSGSFLVSALMEGRNFFGIEKNEEVPRFKRGRVDLVQVARTRLDETWENLEERRRVGLASRGRTRR